MKRVDQHALKSRGRGRLARSNLQLRAVCGWLVLAASACAPRAPTRLQPLALASDDTWISDAIFAQGRLWFRTASGKLSSLAEGENAPVREQVAEPVLDLCVYGGRPLIATCKNEDCDQWALQTREGGGWREATSVDGDGDDFVALSCTEANLLVLSDERLIEVTRAGQRSVSLSDEIRGASAVLPTSHGILVGRALGEWGGGLRRIDSRTGEVTVIERWATGKPCGGPLNTSCDPVNGIASLPWKPGCAAVTTGSLHLIPHGRIVEVCRDRVETLYVRHFDVDPMIAQMVNGPFTVTFFDIARAAGSLLAVGHDGLYRLEPTGGTYVGPFPEFKVAGGVGVSFALPGFVLVLRKIRPQASIGEGGEPPLLVSR